MKKYTKYIALVLLLTILALSFTACIPQKADKIKSKLEKNGYTVLLTEDSAQFNGLQSMIRAHKEITRNGENKTISITVMVYDTIENAKISESRIENDLDTLHLVYGEFTSWGRTKNIVFVGDKDAVKDLR